MILAFAFTLAFLVVAGLWAIAVGGLKGHRFVHRWRAGIRELDGFLVRPCLFYHPGHTWVLRGNGDTVRIGLDDFGRRLADGIRSVVLPPRGSAIREGSVVVELDCGRRKAALLSPVDGVVINLNPALLRKGSALEHDPYGKGWLFEAKVSSEKFTRLPTGAAALRWLRAETNRLSVFLNDEVGVTAADGGELISRPPSTLEGEQWESLAREFFGTPTTSGGDANALPLEKGAPS